MNVLLQERLIAYSLAHMRGEIHKAQLKIIELKAQLTEFDGYALSSFAAGSIKSLSQESDESEQMLSDKQHQLSRLTDDYRTVQELWHEVRNLDLADAVKAFWDRS